MVKYNILQYNINGMINPTNMSQSEKCNKIYQIMRSKQIDFLLLQEWSATLRYAVTPKNPRYIDRNNNPHTVEFPINLFPKYKVHFTGTETAILYRETLSITPLNSPVNYSSVPDKRYAY